MLTAFSTLTVSRDRAQMLSAFRATQDFLIPEDKKHQTLAAIYHEAVPAWALDGKGNLIGCLFRNTWGISDRKGAQGTDPAPHTQHHVLRVPWKLERRGRFRSRCYPQRRQARQLRSEKLDPARLPTD